MQGGRPLPRGRSHPGPRRESARSGGFGGREERRADIIQRVQERSSEPDGESARSEGPPDWKVPDFQPEPAITASPWAVPDGE